MLLGEVAKPDLIFYLVPKSSGKGTVNFSDIIREIAKKCAIGTKNGTKLKKVSLKVKTQYQQ